MTAAATGDAVPDAATPELPSSPGIQRPPILGKALPGLLAVAAWLIFTWRLGQPHAWRDEGATVAAVSRSPLQLAQLLIRTDMVHGLYYYLVQAFSLWFDPLLAGRQVSAFCQALTVVFLYLIGARLLNRSTAVTAAVLMMASPFASRYAQEARPFALAALFATASVWLLLVGLEERRRSYFVLYGICVILCGLANVLALLIVVVHCAEFVRCGRGGYRRWLWALAAAGTALSPFLIVVYSQRQQMAWRKAPSRTALAGLPHAFWPVGSALWIALLAVALVAVLNWRGKVGRAIMVGALWGFVLPLILWIASQVDPLYDARYLVFCLPGAALAGAAAANAVKLSLPRVAVPIVLCVAVTWSGLSTQVSIRRPPGHAEDLKILALTLGQQAKPGDAVLYYPAHLRFAVLTYRVRTPGLRDLALATSGPASATLAGTEVPPPVLAQRLGQVSTVFLVGPADDRPVDGEANGAIKSTLTQRCFRQTNVWPALGFAVRRFTRVCPPPLQGRQVEALLLTPLTGKESQ